MAIKFPDSEPRFGHPTQLPIRKLRDATAAVLRAEKVWQNYMGRARMRLETVKDPEQHALVTIVRLDALPPTDSLNEHLRTCVNDGRSALDNLIAFLAQERGANEKQLKSVAFPFLGAESEWKKQRWDRRLEMLPEDTIARLRRVQPFTCVDTSGPPHPLATLHALWNADKHRSGFSAAIGFSPATDSFELANFSFTLETEHIDELERAIDVDRMVDLDLSPINDGSRLLVIRIPEEVNLDDFEVGSVQAQVTLGLVGPGVSITDSAIAMLKNALRYGRDTVRYVAGVVETMPVEFPPGLIRRFAGPQS